MRDITPPESAIPWKNSQRPLRPTDCLMLDFDTALACSMEHSRAYRLALRVSVAQLADARAESNRLRFQHSATVEELRQLRLHEEVPA